MANHNTKNLRRGPWLEEEDERLTTIIGALGERHWDALAKQSGLRRSGKSCRLRWMNYLRPNLKHGEITNEEEHIILNLQKQWGNKWSRIARRLPGRTDNEIKNYWRSHLKKKIEAQQEFFGGVLNDKKQDFMTSKCNEKPNQESCMNKKDGVFGNSSLEASDSSNMNAFMNDLPYENRMTDGISCSWPCEENEQTDEAKYHEDCMGTYPCFCQLGSSSEESETHCVWDLWSPI